MLTLEERESLRCCGNCIFYNRGLERTFVNDTLKYETKYYTCSMGNKGMECSDSCEQWRSNRSKEEDF